MASSKRVIRGLRVIRCPYDGSEILVEANLNDTISFLIAKGRLQEIHRVALRRRAPHEEVAALAVVPRVPVAHGERVTALWADPATFAAVGDYVARTMRKG